MENLSEEKIKFPVEVDFLLGARRGVKKRQDEFAVLIDVVILLRVLFCDELLQFLPKFLN